MPFEMKDGRIRWWIIDRAGSPVDLTHTDPGLDPFGEGRFVDRARTQFWQECKVPSVPVGCRCVFRVRSIVMGDGAEALLHVLDLQSHAERFGPPLEPPLPKVRISLTLPPDMLEARLHDGIPSGHYALPRGVVPWEPGCCKYLQGRVGILRVVTPLFLEDPSAGVRLSSESPPCLEVSGASRLTRSAERGYIQACLLIFVPNQPAS